MEVSLAQQQWGDTDTYAFITVDANEGAHFGHSNSLSATNSKFTATLFKASCCGSWVTLAVGIGNLTVLIQRAFSTSPHFPGSKAS
jgi:hypothetical protein